LNNGENSKNVKDKEGEEVLDELVELKTDESEAGPSTIKAISGPHENELTPQIKDLIRACRVAETSGDMKKVIKSKLLKYYHSVHPDFVTSKNFVKTLKTTTEEILREPHLVYTKLQLIIEELDARRKSKATVFTNDESVDVKGTGDEEKDTMLKKLYKALVKIKQHIKDLEEAEVDWDDDDDSAYIKKVRFEKRACDIYEKICEITGESTHAHRIVKKPITFKGTDFPEFNKKLQKIVNAKNSFPNFLDVLKTLDYCNKKHKFGLVADQLKRVAQDAFEKLGKTLQKRRKDDLYESTTFYIGKTTDPAKEDPELRSQLEKNKKFYAKYDDIINE
jgi:death-associated protein 6